MFQEAPIPFKKKPTFTFVQKNKPKEGVEDLKNYLLQLKNDNTVTEIMRHLCRLSALTMQDIKDRNWIRDKIQQLLKPFYPDCQVFIFGSTGNGFGAKGCDLDLLFLPTLEYYRLGEEVGEEEEPPTRDQVERGEFSLDYLSTMGEKAQLRFILRILRRSAKCFYNTMVIPAKCPIMSFVAEVTKNSKICCDLSCRNRLVVCNTDLLNFFRSLDQRVEPLVITLRFWAKCLGFIRVVALSSYALTLLVIFFLQNTSPPILPDVDFLMQISDSSCIVAGWETSFSHDLDLIPKTENTDSESILLQKFFSFYWNFDFARNAICVRTGKVTSIGDLKNIEGFKISAVCVQDPFNLSHNVSKNFKQSNLAVFKPAMLIAINILDGNPDHEKFSMLFEEESIKDRIECEFYFQDLGGASPILIALDSEVATALGNGLDLLERFYEKSSWAVFELLQHGYLMECEIIDKKGFGSLVKCEKSTNSTRRNQSLEFTTLVDENESIDMESFDSISENQNSGHPVPLVSESESENYQYGNCLLTIQCAVYNRTWVKRKLAESPTEFDSDTEELFSVVLRTENAISKKIVRSNPHLSCEKPVMWFLCRCYKTNHSQLPFLVVKLSRLTQTKEFKQVHHFLMLSLPKAVKQVLLEGHYNDI